MVLHEACPCLNFYFKPNTKLNLSRTDVFRNAYSQRETCASCPDLMSESTFYLEQMKLKIYDDSAKIRECKKCPSHLNCKNKTANICFGCSGPWCKKTESAYLLGVCCEAPFSLMCDFPYHDYTFIYALVN